MLKSCIDKILSQAHGPIYVHCDGPRESSSEITNHKLISTYLQELKDSGLIASMYVQPTNLGLNSGIFFALDWFFEQVEIGIIVEEDLLLHAPILEIAESIAGKLEIGNGLAAINLRNTVPSKFLKEPNATYRYSNLASSHGWITNAETWRNMPKTQVNILDVLTAFTKVSQTVLMLVLTPLRT
jgi:hypothetical protein